jgi:hypothetical protein
MNKELEYRKQMHELLKDVIDQATEDETTLGIIKKLFLNDGNDVEPEDLIKKLTDD